MWNKPNDEKLSKVPIIYATDFIQPKDKIIYLHFFIGDCDWYIAEYDGNDTFFGFAILNGDDINAEWGLISFSDLESIRLSFVEVDNDLYFEPKRASEIEKIKKCMSGI